MEGRLSIPLVGCALALAPAPLPQDGAPSQKEISRELAEMHREDQKDQNEWTMEGDADFSRRQKVRRDRVLEIVELELLDGVEDYDHAAVLLQHGDGPEDFLLAHMLSVPCGLENIPFGRFMTAATLDRYLMIVGYGGDRGGFGLQIFGTQSSSEFPGDVVYEEYPAHYVDETLRQIYDAGPPLRLTSEAKKELKKRPEPPSPKTLKKLLSQAESGQEGWLEDARAIARGGGMKSDRDYLLAARVLLHSEEPDDLLMAHVCAVAALFKKKKAEDGRWLAAHTLDRFLLSTKKSQKLGTVVGEDGHPVEPYDRSWKNFLRREYGAPLLE